MAQGYGNLVIVPKYGSVERRKGLQVMSSTAFKHQNRGKLHGFARLPGVRFPTVAANQPRIIMSDRHELALVG